MNNKKIQPQLYVVSCPGHFFLYQNLNVGQGYRLTMYWKAGSVIIVLKTVETYFNTILYNCRFVLILETHEFGWVRYNKLTAEHLFSFELKPL